MSAAVNKLWVIGFYGRVNDCTNIRRTSKRVFYARTERTVLTVIITTFVAGDTVGGLCGLLTKMAQPAVTQTYRTEDIGHMIGESSTLCI
jgi:hypothetical protein